MDSISIVGFGRFGKTLYRLFKDDYHVIAYDIDKNAFENYQNEPNLTISDDLGHIYESVTIFFAVPISAFEKVVRAHQPHFTANHLLIDVLSVKTHPANVFTDILKKSGTQALLTHPMFGPDSSKEGFHGLPIVLDQFRTSDEKYDHWRSFFEEKGLKVVEISADEHDRMAANSQGVAHFVGRLLEKMDFTQTPIDTQGAKKLFEIMEQTCNDTWELFHDLQSFNPHTNKMRHKLGKSYEKLYNKLLPQQIHDDRPIFGIQGGAGSFNEQALQYYTTKENVDSFETRYLYTTKRVLAELHHGAIDRGQFAIHNSIGGIVEESIRAMANYTFEIVEEFAIPIQHFMMKHPDANVTDIDTLMTHPQVLKQCKTTLTQQYPEMKKTSGDGDLIDHARAAKALAEGELDKNIAILGPKILADLYELDIIDQNLQDDDTNNTSFLMVKRKNT